MRTRRFESTRRGLRQAVLALGLVVALPASAAQTVPEIILYEFDNFGGRSFRSAETFSSFNPGWNDRALSAIVLGGSWQVCTDVYFRGRCETLPPGQYPTLRSMRLDNKISSARILAWQDAPGPNVPGGTGPRAAPSQPGGPPGGGWGGGARALLYEHKNFEGRMVVVNNEVAANLANAGFNDRASSLRIEGGYWMFCSEPNFMGECLTFGPGDYATLPGGLNNRISSGRRIRDHYPYSQSPNWQR